MAKSVSNRGQACVGSRYVVSWLSRLVAGDEAEQASRRVGTKPVASWQLERKARNRKKSRTLYALKDRTHTGSVPSAKTLSPLSSAPCGKQTPSLGPSEGPSEGITVMIKYIQLFAILILVCFGPAT